MHNADDPERRAVEKSGFRTERLQRDRASDDAGVGLEVPAPRAGAEDGRRGADAERERDHGSYGEPGIAGEAARRIRDVAPQIVQPEERRSSHRCYLYNTDVIKIACRE